MTSSAFIPLFFHAYVDIFYTFVLEACLNLKVSKSRKQTIFFVFLCSLSKMGQIKKEMQINIFDSK